MDDRNTHYLGREYMFHRRWKECIETLHAAPRPAHGHVAGRALRLHAVHRPRA